MGRRVTVDVARISHDRIDRNPVSILQPAEETGLAPGVTGDATGLLDHEHLTGAMAAMQAAGLSWTRLQPDAAYVRELSKADDAFVDVDANTPFLPTDRDPPLEPDEDSDHPVGVYLTAGVIELFDRWEAGNWSPNLDAVLHNPEK